jgi:hypothetical protein
MHRSQNDGRLAVVGDLVADVEEVFVVDRNRSPKFQPLAILPNQRHRVSDPEAVGSLQMPFGFGSGQLQIDAGRIDPAELRIEWLRAA